MPPRSSPAVPKPADAGVQGLNVRVPHDLDAERAVLGAMLLDNDIIPDVMQFVKEADFYLGAHQVLYSAMVEMHDKGSPVELNLIADELRRRGKLDEAGGTLAIASLEQFVLSTGAAPELARKVADKATLRRLMGAADAIIRDCAEEKHAADKQVDIAEKLVFDISQQTQAGTFVTIGDLLPQAIEEVGRLRTHGADVTGVPTGFRDLDSLLNGLHKNDLLILAARPSIGKTAFALNIALNVAHDHKVPTAVFSLEMGREELNMRLLCAYSQTASHRVRRGLIKEAEFAKIRQSASELEDCPIFIDDTPGISLMQLRARARRLKAQQPNLGLIIVDYLQLMTLSERTGREINRQQEVSEISRGLKALARELQVPLMALSQLSRNIEQRSGKEKSARPMLSDLRESGAIEQDADIVMFVHRERVEAKKDDEGKPVLNRAEPIPTEIIIGKHRNGPIGTAQILFWPDFTRFTDMAK